MSEPCCRVLEQHGGWEGLVKANLASWGEGGERKRNEANVKRYERGMSSTVDSLKQSCSLIQFIPWRANVREGQTEWLGEMERKEGAERERESSISLGHKCYIMEL